jgi:uncharacterized OB-fold protein
MSYFSHPLPPIEPVEEDTPFWQHVRAGRLHFQRCQDCSTYAHPPTLHCPQCGSPRRGWLPAPSLGVLFSFTVVHRAAHPSVRDDLPYNVVLVAFPECGNVRLVTNAVDIAPEDLRIGMALEIFIDGTGDTALPHARMVRA